MCQRNQLIASVLSAVLAGTFLATATLTTSSIARAQQAQAGLQLHADTEHGTDAAVSGNASAADSASASASDEKREPEAAYGPPWGTAPGSFELGIYWGAFIPSSKHELYDASRSGIRFQRLERVTPEIGLRVAWFPLCVLGIEAETALIPSQTRDTNEGVTLWTARGHVVLQAPSKPVVPFLLAGGGVLGISSSKKILGNDFDGALHFGAGLKGYISKNLALRLEGRGNVTQGYGADKRVVHWEGLLGASVVLGRPEPPPPPPDTDGDGVIDERDQCPQLAGVPPLGCPPPPPDEDGDGVPDAEDRCPGVAGVASSDPEKNGCPLPPPDGDGDGVPDAEDKCPTVIGDGPDGCPQDTDGDGIPNRDDKCPDQAETENGFEDEDGCPDEVPQEVKKFTGTIKGIAFESGKATIRPQSFPTLDAAAKVLAEYQALRVEISGHTDSTGTPEGNMTLSRERAEAVKLYLAGRGVAEDRIETRGAGQDEPVADNATKEGRAQNRRIEFKLLQKPPRAAAGSEPPAPEAAPTPDATAPSEAPEPPEPGAGAGTTPAAPTTTPPRTAP